MSKIAIVWVQKTQSLTIRRTKLNKYESEQDILGKTTTQRPRWNFWSLRVKFQKMTNSVQHFLILRTNWTHKCYWDTTIEWLFTISRFQQWSSNVCLIKLIIRIIVFFIQMICCNLKVLTLTPTHEITHLASSILKQTVSSIAEQHTRQRMYTLHQRSSLQTTTVKMKKFSPKLTADCATREQIRVLRLMAFHTMAPNCPVPLQSPAPGCVSRDGPHNPVAFTIAVAVAVSEWVFEWTSEWMHQWVSEQASELLSEWVSECVSE